MPLQLSDLQNIVRERDFNRLIGEVENYFFDAKSQPYQLDQGDRAKREFAKDIAAFANASGGYILVGFSTTPSTFYLGEEVSECRPLLRSLFEPERHHRLIVEWLYPRPKDIEINWVQFGDHPDKGIGVILVPTQENRLKPFLIKKTVEQQKTTEILFGYAERRSDQTDVRNIVEIQQALRTGLNFEPELLGRIENLEKLVERYMFSEKQAGASAQREQLLKERIARLLEEDNG
ncbi:MAG TPA: RNA-binding domain-containing protein [Candidatus Angelobacter sp.]|nr:RNA-binding domain-containing protein [Candidatus Angelobacter sp.]